MIRGNVVKTSPVDERNLYFSTHNSLENYLASDLAKVGQIVRESNGRGGYDLLVVVSNGSGGLTTQDLVDKSKLQETRIMISAPTTSTTGKAGDVIEVDGTLYECFGQNNGDYIWKKVGFGGGMIFSGDTTVTPNITPEKQLENAIKAGDITPGMLVSLLEDGKYKNYIIQTINTTTGACTKTQSGGSGSSGTLATVSTGTSWFGSDPYTSTVTVTGYTVTNKTMVSVLPSTDVIEQMTEDGITNIFITNNNGTLTATAVGTAPTAAMTLQVLCTESDQSATISSLPGIVGNGVLKTLQANDLTDAINKLGTAINGKQDKPATATVSTGTSWFGSDPYTSTVTVTGYTVTGKTMVSILPSNDVIAQMIEDGTTNIFITNNNGTLMASAIGAAPTEALTLQVLCTEND